MRRTKEGMWSAMRQNDGRRNDFVSPQGLALNSRRLLSLVMFDRQVGLAGHPHPEAHVLRETSKQSGWADGWNQWQCCTVVRSGSNGSWRTGGDHGACSGTCLICQQDLFARVRFLLHHLPLFALDNFTRAPQERLHMLEILLLGPARRVGGCPGQGAGGQ